MKQSEILFLSAGALAMTAAVLYRLRAARIAAWHRATGTVVEIRRSDLSENDNTAPVVKFRPPEQSQDVVFERSIDTNLIRYRIGESVEVLYDPREPTTATIASVSEVYLMPLFVAGASICLALAGALVAYATLD